MIWAWFVLAKPPEIWLPWYWCWEAGPVRGFIFFLETRLVLRETAELLLGNLALFVQSLLEVLASPSTFMHRSVHGHQKLNRHQHYSLELSEPQNQKNPFFINHPGLAIVLQQQKRTKRIVASCTSEH